MGGCVEKGGLNKVINFLLALLLSDEQQPEQHVKKLSTWSFGHTIPMPRKASHAEFLHVRLMFMAQAQYQQKPKHLNFKSWNWEGSGQVFSDVAFRMMLSWVPWPWGRICSSLLLCGSLTQSASRRRKSVWPRSSVSWDWTKWLIWRWAYPGKWWEMLLQNMKYI